MKKKRYLGLFLALVMIFLPVADLYGAGAEEDDRVILEGLVEKMDQSFYRIGALDSDQDRNVLDRVLEDLSKYEIEGLELGLKSSTDLDMIDSEGNIHYYFEDPASLSASELNHIRQVGLVLEFRKGEASLTSKEYRVAIPWDKEKVRDHLEREVLPLIDEDKIRGANEGLDSLKEDLVLARRPRSYVRVDWELEGEGGMELLARDPLSDLQLKINRGREDRRGRLLAQLSFNHADVSLNRAYDLLVKKEEGLGADDLARLLDEKYRLDLLKYSANQMVIDPDWVEGDIQLVPTARALGIKGNYKLTASTDSEDAKVTGARVNVIRRTRPKDITLTVTIEDRKTGDRASKDFRLRIAGSFDEEELEADLAKMARAQAAYFDGIKGTNPSPDRIVDNLQALKGFNFRGEEMVYVYDLRDVEEDGIVLDSLEGWESQEKWRTFRSSRPELVSHENLLVTRPGEDSWLSLESALTMKKYEAYVGGDESHPSFARLYKQPVVLDLRVLGTGLVEEDPDPIIREDKETVGLTIRGYRGEILAGEYALEPGDTALSLSKRALDQKGISYEEDHGYIRSIDGQAEYDKGPTSGWTYQVNGRLPDTMAGGYDLVEGDNLKWTYINNYQDLPLIGEETGQKDGPGREDGPRPTGLAEDLSQASSKDLEKKLDLALELGAKEGVRGLELEIDREVKLSQELFQLLKKRGVDRLTIRSQRLSLVFDPGDFEEDLRILMGGPDGLDLGFLEGGKKLGSLPRPVRLEVDLAGLERPELMRLRGATGRILPGVYDREGNRLVLRTRELGQLSLEEGGLDLVDLEGHWAQEELEVLAQQGLILGLEGGSFQPDREISRAEFMVLVTRILDLDLEGGRASFQDVEPDAWYGPALAQAEKLGLIEGPGDGNFYPDQSISREELASLLAKILSREDFPEGGEEDLLSYRDRGEISSWSRSSLASLSKHGIFQGDGRKMINPKKATSRAEAGLVVSRLYKLILFN